MNTALVLSAFGTFELVAIGGSFLLLHGLEQQKQMRARLAAVRTGVRSLVGDTAHPPASSAVRALIEATGGAMLRSGLLSRATVAKLRTTVGEAGLHNSFGLRLFVGSKLLALTLSPLLTWMLLHALHWSNALVGLLIAVAAIAGMLLPDLIIRRVHAANARALERGLPDALDLMVICTDAGMGLEYALARTASELQTVHPKLTHQLVLVGNDIRVLSDRRAAFRNMGARVGLESFRRLGTTLLQSLQYGTPLGGSLRTLASELRDEAQTRFEAKAGRLPVLLTLPMVVFILPCLFMIVGGPAGLRIARAFSHH